MKRLLVHPQLGLGARSSTLPALYNNVLPRYHSTDKHDDTGHTTSEIGEKARSTAEEFLRVAKEKSDEVSEGAKETLHETKEAVLGESDDEKEKFNQKVEEGRYYKK